MSGTIERLEAEMQPIAFLQMGGSYSGGPVITCPANTLLNTTTGICQAAYVPPPPPPSWLTVLIIGALFAILAVSYFLDKKNGKHKMTLRRLP